MQTLWKKKTEHKNSDIFFSLDATELNTWPTLQARDQYVCIYNVAGYINKI